MLVGAFQRYRMRIELFSFEEYLGCGVKATTCFSHTTPVFLDLASTVGHCIFIQVFPRYNFRRMFKKWDIRHVTLLPALGPFGCLNMKLLKSSGSPGLDFKLVALRPALTLSFAFLHVFLKIVHIFTKHLKRNSKSSRFATSGSMIALLFSEILPSIFFCDRGGEGIGNSISSFLHLPN